MLYVIRHGKTDWNKECKFQGAKDIPINEEGRQAARVLSERLSNVKFDMFLCEIEYTMNPNNSLSLQLWWKRYAQTLHHYTSLSGHLC